MSEAAVRRAASRSGGDYVGRFAPSPTGPLHFGSVLAAIGSWLDARAAGGSWHLRLDDLDRPRNVDGAETRIVDELRRLGLDWDGEVLRQSDNLQPYREALARLQASHAAFDCGCSRRDLVDGNYPGTCRQGLAAGMRARSVRFRVNEEILVVDDGIQGRYAQNLQSAPGDFVLLRADGIFAYHLATVLDDARLGISHVVRGSDLLDSTPRQIALQRALGLTTPRYAHLPVLTNAEGQKLSKQTHAQSTEGYSAAGLWCAVLRLLGHPGAEASGAASLKDIQDWAINAWSLSRVPQGPITLHSDSLHEAFAQQQE